MTTFSASTLTVPDSPAAVEIDTATGLPSAITLDLGERRIRTTIATTVQFVIGGNESQNPVGGLEYHDTTMVSEVRLTSGNVRTVHNGDSVDLELDAVAGPVGMILSYRLFAISPYVEFSVRLSAIDEPVIVRDMTLRVAVSSSNGTELTVNAPGNHVRRDLPLSVLADRALAVSPLGGLEGSSGVIMVTADGVTTSVWPNSTGEILDVFVERVSDDRALIRASALFAGELAGAGLASVRVATFDIALGEFALVKTRWHSWARRYGLTSPPGKPQWAPAASLFEVQVGGAPYWGGHVNEPYSAISEVTADLDRIQSLGFSVIQLMPRQPYPSYNVHDYWDIDTTYGDVDQLKTLVSECHARGMTVILDVLLHGVVDKESIDQTIAAVLDGPYANRLDEPLKDVFVQPDRDQYLIGWSRHILDFGPAWRDGSPDRNRHEEENPDWFFRDSAGQVTGVYTKAFDARQPSMQRYFRSAMLFLMTELDIDGFRFDAPTYNYFANWAPWARLRGSASPLACVALFEDMREDIKGVNPQALMYTEPSGHLLRRSMDLNYNYDESWLVAMLGRTVEPMDHWARNAREFMQWHQDRDAFLPLGSMTAHHVDSHDSYWWSDWGSKWRREQFALERVQSLTAAYLALDGPFMMFVGGEVGIEDVLSNVGSVRRARPGFWSTPGEFVLADTLSPNLFWIRRVDGIDTLDVLVNLGDDDAIDVPTDMLPPGREVIYRLRTDHQHDRVVIDPDGILVVGSTRA